MSNEIKKEYQLRYLDLTRVFDLDKKVISDIKFYTALENEFYLHELFFNTLREVCRPLVNAFKNTLLNFYNYSTDQFFYEANEINYRVNQIIFCDLETNKQLINNLLLLEEETKQQKSFENFVRLMVYNTNKKQDYLTFLAYNFLNTPAVSALYTKKEVLTKFKENFASFLPSIKESIQQIIADPSNVNNANPSLINKNFATLYDQTTTTFTQRNKKADATGNIPDPFAVMDLGGNLYGQFIDYLNTEEQTKFNTHPADTADMIAKYDVKNLNAVTFTNDFYLEVNEVKKFYKAQDSRTNYVFTIQNYLVLLKEFARAKVNYEMLTYRGEISKIYGGLLKKENLFDSAKESNARRLVDLVRTGTIKKEKVTTPDLITYNSDNGTLEFTIHYGSEVLKFSKDEILRYHYILFTNQNDPSVQKVTPKPEEVKEQEDKAKAKTEAPAPAPAEKKESISPTAIGIAALLAKMLFF